MSKLNIIQSGAEAKIILDEKTNNIIKDRISKGYRISQIDKKVRILRTRSETKLLEKASSLINAPKPQPPKDKYVTQIVMPLIKGKKLSEHLDSLTKPKQKKVCIEIGKSIAKLHDNNIIHGDLTTSNIILEEKKKKEKVFFIDFGLGFISTRVEDKAVDLHLIKQALEAKHFNNWETHTKYILEGYKTSKNATQVLNQLKKVESRGRYKDKY
ncbi:MAG TPA: KEOPS complex kinase/ATPase Bud32 [Candidatus Paceibacterota bacterium]|nr:KEOPS complex kinase/ATPase Bud32 [Candidatus Paceibacterota bacterium]